LKKLLKKSEIFIKNPEYWKMIEKIYIYFFAKVNLDKGAAAPSLYEILYRCMNRK